MNGDGQGARTGSTISADLAELKRAALQLAGKVMEWAASLPKGARRTIAFAAWELLLYGTNERTSDDQPVTIQAKFDALRYAIECCVPIEPQKRIGSMIELIEGSDHSDIEDDPAEKKKARKKLMSLETNNKRLARDLEKAYAQIADLTGQVTHLRDMKSRQPAPAQSATLHVSESNSVLVEKVRGLELQVEQALALVADRDTTIEHLRDAQRNATLAFAAKLGDAPATAAKPTRSEKPVRIQRAQALDPIKEDRHGLSPWAWGHFKKTAELTGITFEYFRIKVRNGTIDAWRDEQRTNGSLSEYQWRFVAGVAREVAEQLGSALVLAAKPARQKSKSFAKPKKSVESSAAEGEVITVSDRRFAESDFLSHAFAKAWYSAVHKETGCKLATLVMRVHEGTIGQWLDGMDRSSPPERTRRCAVALLRHIATVLGVTPIEKKGAKIRDREVPQPEAPPTFEPAAQPAPSETTAEPVAAPVQMSLEQVVNGAALFGFLMDQDAVGQYSRLHDAGYLRSLMQVCQAAGYDGALKNYVASRMEAMTGTLDDVLVQDAVELARHVVAFVPIWNGGGCLDEDKLMAHAINAGREDALEPIADPQPRPKPVPVVLPAQPAPKPPLENGDSNEIDDELIRHIKSLNRRNVLKERLVRFYDRLRSLGFCEDLWDLFRIVETNQAERRIEWMLSNTSTSDYDVRNARELCRFVKNDLGVIDRVTHRLSPEGLAEFVRLNAHKRTH